MLCFKLPFFYNDYEVCKLPYNLNSMINKNAKEIVNKFKTDLYFHLSQELNELNKNIQNLQYSYNDIQEYKEYYHSYCDITDLMEYAK